RLGLRGYPAGMVPSLGRVMPLWARANDQALAHSVAETLAEIGANLRFALDVNRSFDDRIRPMMAATVTVAHTRETLLALKAAAAQLGNGLHMHLQGGSGRGGQENLIVRSTGMRGSQLLVEFSFLEDRLFG